MAISLMGFNLLMGRVNIYKIFLDSLPVNLELIFLYKFKIKTLLLLCFANRL